jgi:hypothetical protein
MPFKPVSDSGCEPYIIARDTVYGSFFAPTNQPGKFFCLLHGSGSHATGGCDKLKKLRDRWGLERWNPSEEPKLCQELWQSAIINPCNVHEQAAIREQQWQENKEKRQQQSKQGQPQSAAAVPATPSKRAGPVLAGAPIKRLPFGSALAAAAMPRALAGITTTQQQSVAPAQQQQLLPTSSMPSAAAPAAVPAAAPVAVDSNLLAYMIRHSSEESKRANEKMEEKMTMVVQLQQQISELQSQLTALNLQGMQLEEQRDTLAAEENCFWEHCTCSARGRAAAVLK